MYSEIQMGNCIKQQKITAREFIKDSSEMGKSLLEVCTNGKALETASNALKETKQVAAMAIVSAPESIKFVGEKLKNDAHLAALSVLVSNGAAEKDLNDAMKGHPLIKHIMDYIKGTTNTTTNTTNSTVVPKGADAKAAK